MMALPSAFAEIENLEVIIAGADRCAYSYKAPTNNGSWKEHMLQELKGKIPIERIHFTGLLNYTDYRKLLWRSDLHCYFTRPYVTSWSLFEAASCGAKLISNKNGATTGIVEEHSSRWVDIDDQLQINNEVIEGLKESIMGNSRRSQIKKGYELTRSLTSWQRFINECIVKKGNQE